MRARGGAAIVAAVAMVGWTVTGCGLTRDLAPTPSASGSPATPSPSVRPSSHAVPEAPGGVSDVWIPADYFVLTTVLAVSETGDALVAFSDDARAWENGTTPFGIATVTPDGTVDRLVEPGSSLLDDALPFFGALTDTTAAVYLGGETSQTADRILLIDTQTGSAELSPPTFVGPDGEQDDLTPTIALALVDDTVLWPQITSAGAGTLMSLSLEDGIRVHATDDPLLEGALSDVLVVGRDYCSEHGFWVLGHDIANSGPVTSASGSLGADGRVALDEGSLVTPTEGRFSLRELRCGASVLRSVRKEGDSGRGPLKVLTPGDPAGALVETRADTAVPVAITRDWILVEDSDPLSSGGSLRTLISRHDDTRGTIEVDGTCALISPKIAGSTIAWVAGAHDTDPQIPLGPACTVAVGTLASS